jgi:hypothetical protein
MKTVVITTGDARLPPELEDVINRGSTTVDRHSASDFAPTLRPPKADRIVFWSAAPDPTIRQLATGYAQAEARAHKEMLVYVTAVPGDTIAGVAPSELFVWPQDKDRLTMAFLTGA